MQVIKKKLWDVACNIHYMDSQSTTKPVSHLSIYHFVSNMCWHLTTIKSHRWQILTSFIHFIFFFVYFDHSVIVLSMFTLSIKKMWIDWMGLCRGGSRISSSHLKKFRRDGGGAKSFGVFRVKNHDFTPKNHFFSNFRGCTPWIRP